MQSHANAIVKDFGDNMEVWRTEYNFPTWGSGIPFVENKNGALHGIYYASYVLAAI